MIFKEKYKLIYPLLSGLFVASLVTSPSLAQEGGEDQIVEKRLANLSSSEEELQKKVFLRSEYYSVSNEATQISGTALAVGLYFARNEKLSIGPRFHQSYAANSGWSTLYTALNFDFTYALTGTLKIMMTKRELNGWEYFTYKGYNPGGWRVRFSLDQYYYNTTQGSFPLSGFGLELAYEFPSSADFSIEVGAGMDRISNPTVLLTPFRAYISFMDMF